LEVETDNVGRCALEIERCALVASSQQILAIRFFDGTVAEAVDHSLEKRGLVVAPSGACFRPLTEDEVYRTAMTQADIVLPERLLSDPRRFLPRALSAFALPHPIMKYGENIPPLRT
jgi:hypothetical protein